MTTPKLTTLGEATDSLERLVSDSFSREELERFAIRLNPDAKLHEVLPGQIASRSQTAHAFVRSLLDRGLLDKEFFRHLASERPRKIAQITEIARFFLHQEEQVALKRSAFLDDRIDPPVPQQPAVVAAAVLFVALMLGLIIWQATSAREPTAEELITAVAKKTIWNINPATESLESETVEAPAEFFESTDGWQALIRNQDPWALNVVAALNDRAADKSIEQSQFVFQFELLICGSGAIADVKSRGSSDPLITPSLVRILRRPALAVPPPPIREMLSEGCRRIPYKFTWVHEKGRNSIY